MRKIFLLFPMLFAIALMSCNKNKSCGFTDSSKTAPTNEQTALADSLEKYNIIANQHPSGVYYKVINPGTTGVVSNLCAQVTASYWGGFFDGKGFDSSETPIPFTLGQTIIGWQKAIPMVKGGGEIYIYIPPSLAYGAKNVTDQTGKVIIPANSYLVFKVKVKSIE